LVHAGKYKLKMPMIHELNNPEKANNAKHSKTKQNYPGSVTSYNTRPGNEVGLIYNTPEPTWG